MAASNLFSNSMATHYEAYQEQLNRDMRRQVDQMNAIGQGALAGGGGVGNGGGGGGGPLGTYNNERAMREEQERQKYYAMKYNARAQGSLNQAAAMQNSQNATPQKSEAKRSILLLLPKKGK